MGLPVDGEELSFGPMVFLEEVCFEFGESSSVE